MFYGAFDFGTIRFETKARVNQLMTTLQLKLNRDIKCYYLSPVKHNINSNLKHSPINNLSSINNLILRKPKGH